MTSEYMSKRPTQIGFDFDGERESPAPNVSATAKSTTTPVRRILEKDLGGEKPKKARKGWLIWAIFYGFFLGSFISIVTFGLLLYFSRRTFYQDWYRGMYKRYGVDASGVTGGVTGSAFGATTTGATVGGYTTGGTTMGTTGATETSTTGGTTGGTTEGGTSGTTGGETTGTTGGDTSGISGTTGGTTGGEGETSGTTGGETGGTTGGGETGGTTSTTGASSVAI
ncbi:unnamed protein product [Strongylus vulgaris]|uniref:Uncharacterized protein n=1 Tax=Strongylus vulgaris TaxID=40348 RepID=A0A3P7KJL4_STRVU|nr:unnamed protein product [Strongylus vulgaris]